MGQVAHLPAMDRVTNGMLWECRLESPTFAAVAGEGSCDSSGLIPFLFLFPLRWAMGLTIPG
jgi:hypothetical protein